MPMYKTMEFRDANQNGVEDRNEGIYRIGEMRQQMQMPRPLNPSFVQYDGNNPVFGDGVVQKRLQQFYNQSLQSRQRAMR